MSQFRLGVNTHVTRTAGRASVGARTDRADDCRAHPAAGGDAFLALADREHHPGGRPSAGELWTVAGAPYLLEIADCLSDDDPCNLVTVRKSQQSGASILALAWCLCIADREPANVLYGVPGIDRCAISTRTSCSR
jgi:Phage terminase large subunit gpA, ATPase domain